MWNKRGGIPNMLPSNATYYYIALICDPIVAIERHVTIPRETEKSPDFFNTCYVRRILSVVTNTSMSSNNASMEFCGRVSSPL